MYYKKIKKTGDPLKDMKTFHPYYSDFQENIGTTFSQIYVTMEINGNFFEYREPNNIKWKIENEKKIIGKMTCVKATTRKYGRNWITLNVLISKTYNPFANSYAEATASATLLFAFQPNSS